MQSLKRWLDQGQSYCELCDGYGIVGILKVNERTGRIGGWFKKPKINKCFMCNGDGRVMKTNKNGVITIEPVRK